MGLGVHCSSNAFTPMITGQELIAFVKANPEMDQSELAHAAGFTRIDKNGKERIMAKQFCEALLEAKGVGMRLGRKPGKTAQFETTVHKTGVILLFVPRPVDPAHQRRRASGRLHDCPMSTARFS